MRHAHPPDKARGIHFTPVRGNQNRRWKRNPLVASYPLPGTALTLISPDCVFDASLVPETCLDRFIALI